MRSLIPSPSLWVSSNVGASLFSFFERTGMKEVEVAVIGCDLLWLVVVG